MMDIRQRKREREREREMRYQVVRLDSQGEYPFGIVEPSKCLWAWYGDTVTELQCRDDDGEIVRLCVDNRTGRVLRSCYVLTGVQHANLDKVGGLTRKNYGPGTFGHVDYFVKAAR